MMNVLRSSWATDRSLWRRFVIALLCVAASTALKVLLSSNLGARVTFVTFFPAVVLSALYGGLFGGLLGTALSGCVTLWLDPVGSFTIQEPAVWAPMGVFLIGGALISGVCEGMHRSQARLLSLERQARLAEEHERETLQRYELLAQNSRDIILFIRRDDGRILEANEAAVLAYGYDRAELLERTIHDFRVPLGRPLAETQMDSADAVGLLFETAHRRKDGSTFPVEISARGMTIHGERVLVSLIRDISERRRAEAGLRESEANMRAVLDATKESVYLFSHVGVLLAINQTAAERLKRPAEELIGKAMADVFPAEIAAARLVPLRQVITSGQPVQYQDERVGLTFDLCFYPVTDSEGRVHRVAIFGRDITEQKQLEELLRTQAVELHAADNAKNQFLAMLAHELRNPLGAIANAATLIEMQTVGQERLQKPVEILNRQVKHTARLVDDLLDVSRITRGRFELRKELVDVVGILRRAAETITPQMEVRQHAFTVDLPAGPVWVEADPARLEQIAGNLLNNAAKYTDPGGEVALALWVHGSVAEIRVEDNGSGISPEMLPHIFDLFAQEDRSLDRSKGGLGIGLTLVKSLVEMHGGSVAAHSEGPGRGSMFTARLPVLVNAVNETARPVSVAETPKRRVLVVDDNVDAAQMIASLLETAGHQVFLAHDGPTAIEAARKIRPDMVLLDIGLPGMDGYEVARDLRGNTDLTGTRLVALTGYGREEDRRRSQEAGFDHHLVKPVDMEALKGLLADEGIAY